MKKLMNTACVAMGFVCIGVGCIGIVLPILPTTPFLLLALVLFAKGSVRFHRWFLSTKLYKKYLEDFVVTKSMTKGMKIRVLVIVTLLLAAGFWFSPVFAKVIIVIVAAFHYVYFIFGIKTTEEKKMIPGEGKRGVS
ncbi:YbaN family protein [Clostridium sp. Marseille-P2415]|uniref:YbaN family protein n=1 Tax=Clostridium sp. Marseille-P2415 TaxID=1805471 RepID=UPI00190ED64F|nr:YbaN family protein [Clostridium sp. Marseille-P2415]